MMPKKFLFLLLLLIFVLTGIIVLFFVNNRLLSLPTHTFFTSSPTPKQTSTNELFFQPQTLTIKKGQANTLRVGIHLSKPETDTPHIIQLELAYDPLAFTEIALTPGDFFEQPLITLNHINPRTGRISYALESSREEHIKNTGTVATITVTPNDSFIGTQTVISFLPKTMVREKTEIQNTTKSNEAKIIFVSSEQK